MSELILGMKSARMAADAKLKKHCIANMDISCTMVIEMLDMIDTLTEQVRALEEGAQYILTLCENENVPDMLTKYPEDGHLVALINIKKVAKQMKKYLAKEAE